MGLQVALPGSKSIWHPGGGRGGSCSHSPDVKSEPREGKSHARSLIRSQDTLFPCPKSALTEEVSGERMRGQMSPGAQATAKATNQAEKLIPADHSLWDSGQHEDPLPTPRPGT